MTTKCCYSGKQEILISDFVTKASEGIVAEWMYDILKRGCKFSFYPKFNRNTPKQADRSIFPAWLEVNGDF